MNLKKFFSFVTPLIVMLFTYVIFITISKMVVNYENSINKDYSIVLVSTTPIVKSKIEDIKSIDLKEIIHLKREKILESLKGDLSTGSYELLQKKLPYFYTLHLKRFPTSSVLKKIKKDLLKISGVKSVDTFSKDHDNMYSLLLLVKLIISVLLICVVIFAFLTMITQVKIWFYENKERLDIIKLHGGSIYYGAKPIINIAFLSSIFASLFVIGIIYLIKDNLHFFFTVEMLKLINANFTTYSYIEISSVFLISIVLSLVTVFGILLKYRLK
jgi:cell division transport system permease protein